MAEELTRKGLMNALEEDITIGFNALADKVITELEQKSAVWTGFYASSWKASPSPIVHDDTVWEYNPWSKIKASTLTSKGWVRPTPEVKRRHSIPKFSIDQTMYIANTVEYTSIAFYKSPEILDYAVNGVKKTIDSVFTDRAGTIAWRANI